VVTLPIGRVDATVADDIEIVGGVKCVYSKHAINRQQKGQRKCYCICNKISPRCLGFCTRETRESYKSDHPHTQSESKQFYTTLGVSQQNLITLSASSRGSDDE